MKRRSDKPDDWDALRAKIIGLGGQSIRKSYYPELQQRLADLELFRTLLDQSLDAVFLARIPTGVLTDVNESACRQLGYSRDELLAMSFIDLLAPPESGQIGALLKRKAVLKHGVHVEVSLSKKRGGSIPVEMTLRLVEVRGSAYAVAVVRDMTERRKAGEALRESETMHRLLIDNATDMISRHMPDSTIIYTTPSCERMLGYRPEEMIGRMAGDFVAPGDMEGVWAAFRASREAGEDWYRAEFRMIRRDGATIWTETLGKIIRDEQGKVVEVHSVLRDITERKRAEDALHESEERYRMLFENAIEGIFRTTLDGRAIMCNSALARMLGYDSPQDAVLKLTDIGSQVYADIRERMAVIERLTLEGKVTGSEVLFKRSDGSTMKAMLNVRLVHDERGAPAFIEGSCIDITERWLAQEALKASEEKYRKIFEDATEGIFQTTPEGRYLSVNPAFALMFGFSSPQEMIESVHDIAQELYVNPADRREMVRMLREDDKVQGYEVEVFRKDRSRFWISINIHTVRDASGEVLYFEGTNVDITERKHAQRALQESESRIREIIDNAPFGAHSYKLNAEGQLIFVGGNPAADRILNLDHASLIGREIEEAFPMLKDTVVAENYREVARTGRHWVQEVIRYEDKDIAGAFEVFAFQTGAGRMTAFFLEITKRKKAEAALREREELLRATFNTTADGILVVDGKGRISHMNRRFAQMWRIPKDLQETKDDDNLQAFVRDQLEDPEGFQNKVSELYRSTREDFGELRFKDGRVFERYSCPMILEGKEIGRVWDFRDITERKHAEDALRVSEARYHRLYDSMMDAFVYVAMDGTILECNDAYLAMLGYNADEIRKLAYQDITPEKWRAFEAKIIEKEVLARGYSDIYEKEYRRKDGTVFPVELRAYLMRDQEGRPAGMWAIMRDVTERKQAEERLREANRRLENIIEFLPDATIITDSDKRIIAWNRAMEEMTGVPKAHILGRDHFEAMVPFYGEPGPYLMDFLGKDEEILSRYTNISRKGDAIYAEVFTPGLYQGKGAYVWAIAAPLYDSEGEIIGTIESIRDITEGKQAVEELRKSEEKYREIFEDAVVGIYQSTKDGRYLTVNPAFARIFGFGSPEEMVAGVVDIAQQLYVNPEDRSRLMGILREKDRFDGFDVQIRRKDGRNTWVFMNAHNVRDHQGNLLCYEGTCVDITDRKRAEEALEENEARYRLLAENATDIIFTMDADLRFTYVSPSVERIRGYTVQEAMSQRVDEVLTPGSLKAAMEAFGEELAIEAGEPEDLQRKRTLELEELCKDGSAIWTETIFTSLRDKDKRFIGFLGITRDITERKKSAEEKMRLEMQLSQAQKMESIGTLAGGIAHDFNNILAAIIGYSELALDDISNQEKAKAEISEVLKAGDRAKDLVSQILTFSRKAETAYLPLALRTVIKESLKMLRSVIPTTIEIRQDLADSGLVLSNPTQIHQIIMNLCTNAAHAMDEAGGILEVSLKRVSLGQVVAEGLDVAPGEFLKLTISDTGHGMPPEVMERIFEPYFTTKELGRGTGLGLSVVHGIVKSHRGAVICRSVPGRGTTFEIYLPEIEADKKAAETSGKEPFSTGTERVLFVDDEAALTALAEKMLSKLGYKVSVKTSSVDALEFFKERPHEFDLVITDMTMPGLTGDKMAQRIMEIRPDIPVVLCTGYSEHVSEERARAIGIRAFLLKPLEMRTLARTIRKVLDKK